MPLAPTLPMRAPLPMAGIAPPPMGPRVPDPFALQDMKAGIGKLLDAADKDPMMIGKKLNPVILTLIKLRDEINTPPTPPQEEADQAPAGPLDQTPIGAGLNGTPPAAVPRLLGLPGS